MKDSDIFAIITGTNNKGGVGKTVSAVNLCITLANLGYKTLYVDSDPQGNGTKAMGVRENIDPEQNCLWAAFKKKLPYSDVTIKSPYKNVDVIAATPDLEDAVDMFISSPRRWKLFKQLLSGAEKKYNFIFIDTPPAKGGILTPAALAAADYYLIPSFADSDSYDGFVKIAALCEDIKENENEKLACLGVLITCLKKNPATLAYLEYAAALLKDANLPMFPHYIGQSDTVDSARLLGKPAVTLPNANAIRDAYLANARYLISQVKESKAGRPRKSPDLTKLGLIKSTIPTKHEQEFVLKKPSKNLELEL